MPTKKWKLRYFVVRIDWRPVHNHTAGRSGALFSEGRLITQFVDVVMAPEMFLRNYQTFFTISKSEAQQDMKNPNGCLLRILNSIVS